MTTEITALEPAAAGARAAASAPGSVDPRTEQASDAGVSNVAQPALDLPLRGRVRWAGPRLPLKLPCRSRLSEDCAGEEQPFAPSGSGAPRQLEANGSLNEVELGFAHDLPILKRILERRGVDVGKATHLCDIAEVPLHNAMPCVAGTSCHTTIVDCLGKTTYSLTLSVFNESFPNVFDPDLFDLQRVRVLYVHVRSGPMPPGIERMSITGSLEELSIRGNVTNGLEGPLPHGFWNFNLTSFELTDI